MSMGFSIDSSGGWQPAGRPPAAYPIRRDGVAARPAASEPATAVRTTAAARAPTRRLDDLTGDDAATERLQRIRQLNPEQSLGMALYERAGQAAGGPGRHLDLRV
ncbi:MAG: hypothetical protein AAGG11_01935 [Pseudomonadota bacterium]